MYTALQIVGLLCLKFTSLKTAK